MLMFFRLSFAAAVTALMGYVFVMLLPAVTSTRPLDTGSLVALGGLIFVYGFVMLMIFSHEHREEMDGQDKKV